MLTSEAAKKHTMKMKGVGGEVVEAVRRLALTMAKRGEGKEFYRRVLAAEGVEAVLNCL